MTEYRSISMGYSIIGDVTGKKCVEPKKRWVGGKYGWAMHRFPIKDGITLQEMMRRSLIESMYSARNTILIDMFSKTEPPDA